MNKCENGWSNLSANYREVELKLTELTISALPKHWFSSISYEPLFAKWRHHELSFSLRWTCIYFSLVYILWCNSSIVSEMVGPSYTARSLWKLYFLEYHGSHYHFECKTYTTSLLDASGWRHRAASRRRTDVTRKQETLLRSLPNLIQLGWFTTGNKYIRKCHDVEYSRYILPPEYLTSKFSHFHHLILVTKVCIIIFINLIQLFYSVHVLLLLLLLKKVGSARLRESDLHYISPKTPAPQYQLISRKKRKGKNSRRL